MKHQTLPGQQGLTLISWIVVLAFLLFVGIMVIKVVPVYITDSSIRGIFRGIENDMTLRGKPAKDIRKLIVRRLKINNVYDIKENDIVIKKTRGGYQVTLEYEPRGTLVGNLDYIASFKHEAIVLSR